MNSVSSSDTQLRKLEAVKATLEYSKQITTLSSGFIILSATFVQVFRPQPEWRAALVLSWCLWFISVILGVLFFGAVISHLEKDIPLSTKAHPALPLSRAHVLAFLLGILAFFVFIGANLF